MLTKWIISCLDVTAGRFVKGTKFLNLRDAGDPVECAVAYNEQGADELVFTDRFRISCLSLYQHFISEDQRL